MIYKGIMGDSEISLLLSKFESIYRFTSRGSYVFQINEKDLVELDIEAEVYNDILNKVDSLDGRLILVLRSNSRESIVIDSYIFSTISVGDWLNKKLESPEFVDLINANSLFVVSEIARSTKTLQQFGKVAGDEIWEIATRGNFDSIREVGDLSQITDSINNNNLSNFKRDTFEEVEMYIRHWNQLKSLTEEVGGKAKPILFIVIGRTSFSFNVVINTGYTLGQLQKTLSVSSQGVHTGGKNNRYVEGLKFKPRLKFTEDFKVNNFDKLVDTDAQNFLVAKVRRYALRRVKDGGKKIVGEYVTFDNYFSFAYADIDKNFFTPTRSIEKNIYYIPSIGDSAAQVNNKQALRGLNIGILQFDKPSKNVKLGEAIELSIKAYQEAWGSYKPLSRKFFTGKNENFSRVRELFYNILYAYVDRALGGFISTGGQRKYSPKISKEKILKARVLEPLTDEQENTIRYMNRNLEQSGGKLDTETEKKYFQFVRSFMENRAYSLKGDNIAINYVPTMYEKETKRILSGQGFSTSKQTTGGLYLISIEGIESNNNIFRSLQRDFIIEYTLDNYLSRNLYQYFVEIDLNNKEINVIRPSLVDDASQFKINFQDWDIRIDLINLINSLISKPKDLVVSDKGRVGLTKPANPAERSMYNLSDEVLRRQGVVDHPLTLHYEPMRFNKVTRQRSGHLFFENTNGVLVIFPFDTFYHDIEGQGQKTVDICYTSVQHIYDDKLFGNIVEQLSKPFLEWIKENDNIRDVSSKNNEELNEFEIIAAVKSVFEGNNTTPILTPQVFKARVKSAIKERLDGHIFKNTKGSKAACVYVNTEFEAFYSAGDEGYRLGMNAGDGTFPFSWKAFNNFTGKETVSDLDPRRGDMVVNLRGIYIGNVNEHALSNAMMPLLLNEPSININEIDFYIELFSRYISQATYNNTEDSFKLMVREEIKEYLQKNPEAIQIKKIARRNMSPN